MPSTFAMVPVEACADERLSKIQLRVLVALCSFRNSEHEDVWPFRATLSEKCGYTEQTISRATGELCRLGWLQKVGKGGYSKPCRYRITVPVLNTTRPDETVSEPDTVPDPETVSDPDKQRCPIRVNYGVRSGQGQRTDQEQTKNQTNARTRKRPKRQHTIDNSTGGFVDRATDRSWAE